MKVIAPKAPKTAYWLSTPIPAAAGQLADAGAVADHPGTSAATASLI
jgi:hypothetical protein